MFQFDFKAFYKKRDALLLNDHEAIASCVALDLLNADSIYFFADSWLNEGKYDDTLNELWQSKDLTMQLTLLRKYLTGLGIKIPEKDDSERNLLKLFIRAIAEKVFDPWQGMYFIMNNVIDNLKMHQNTKKYLGDYYDIEKLVGDFYAYDDIEYNHSPSQHKSEQAQIAEINADIILECKNWLSRNV